MKRFLVGIALIGCTGLLNAQDMHFSQGNRFLMLQNPAQTGLFEGWERASIGHKSQWVQSGAKYQTSVVSADVSLFRKRTGQGANLGVGLLLFSDNAGDSRFGTKQMLLSVSGIVPLAPLHKISLGFQAGMGQKSGDFSELVFSNQFNGSELDPDINSGEANNLVSFFYPDFSVGGLYQFGSEKSTFRSGDRPKITTGVAYYHLNKPRLKYKLVGIEQLHSKWVFHANYLQRFSGTDAGIEAVLNQYVQGPHTETNISVLYRYYLSQSSKITGFKKASYLAVGMLYRYKDAVAPMIQMNYKGFDFGLSYDITTSKLGQVNRGGGIEFSLVYTNLDFALFKRQNY